MNQLLIYVYHFIDIAAQKLNFERFLFSILPQYKALSRHLSR